MDTTADQPNLDRSVKTFRACLLYFLPKASVFFVQKRPATPRARHISRVPAKLAFPDSSDDGSLTTPGRVHGEDVAS